METQTKYKLRCNNGCASGIADSKQEAEIIQQKHTESSGHLVFIEELK